MEKSERFQGVIPMRRRISKEGVRDFLQGRGGKILVLGLAYLLGLVFLMAGVSKVLAFEEFLKAIEVYGLFPKGLIPALATLVIGVEIAIGALFFVRRYQGLAAGVATGLLMVFILLAMYARALGLEAECGCFGFVRDQVTGVRHIMQNGVLLVFAVIAYMAH